jgi:hypothetical protein
MVSVLRQKNTGLLLLCLSSVSLPVAAGTLLISILKTLRYAAEYKALIKNIYLMITIVGTALNFSDVCWHSCTGCAEFQHSQPGE